MSADPHRWDSVVSFDYSARASRANGSRVDYSQRAARMHQMRTPGREWTRLRATWGDKRSESLAGTHVISIASRPARGHLSPSPPWVA